MLPDGFRPTRYTDYFCAVAYAAADPVHKAGMHDRFQFWWARGRALTRCGVQWATGYFYWGQREARAGLLLPEARGARPFFM